MIKIHLSKLLGERRITQAELANKTNIRPATINEMYHELIERIKDSNNIVDVISQYVTLKRKGTTYFGLCPFHREKTPSFAVSHKPSRIFHDLKMKQAPFALTYPWRNLPHFSP